jgi:hypothetical protein
VKVNSQGSVRERNYWLESELPEVDKKPRGQESNHCVKQIIIVEAYERRCDEMIIVQP